LLSPFCMLKLVMIAKVEELGVGSTWIRI
jgi:hypothetical protein